MSAGIAVLLYHHVGPVREESCKGLTVLPHAFKSQMSALAAMGYSTILPHEWFEVMSGTRQPPDRAVMITFDDGYADLVEHAFPILQRHSFSACVFLPSTLLGRDIPCSRTDGSARMDVMSADDVKRWARRGMKFGAHSRTHTDLTRLDDSQLEREVRDSATEVSDLTGEKTTAFAYPYGKHNQRVRDVVARYYETAFTLEEGLNEKSSDRVALMRTMVQHSDTMMDACLRARFGRSIFQAARTRLHDVLKSVSS